MFLEGTTLPENHVLSLFAETKVLLFSLLVLLCHLSIGLNPNLHALIPRHKIYFYITERSSLQKKEIIHSGQKRLARWPPWKPAPQAQLGRLPTYTRREGMGTILTTNHKEAEASGSHN